LTGLIWGGHEDGTVRAWCLDSADAAAPALRVADCGVSVIVVDEDTGYAWAGTQEGEIVIVR
jgi:hypothetical protein